MIVARGRHDVDQVGLDLDAADGATWAPPSSAVEIAHERHDLGGDEAGIVAHAHRRRAGVGRLAGGRYFGPRDALHALDDADVDALVLEDRALLDVQLDERCGGTAVGHGSGPGVADAFELVAEAGAVVDGA